MPQSRDPSLHVRNAVQKYLKSLNIAGVGDRWYPQQIGANQTYPYGFLGVPISSPDGIQCLASSTIRFAIHAYTEGEAAANAIGSAIAEQLDGAYIDLQTYVGCPYPATLDLSWISNTPVRDAAESSIFHLISSMVAEVSA